VDTVLTAYDQNMNQVARNDDVDYGTANLASAITLTSYFPQTFYVQVKQYSWSGNAVGNKYTIDISNTQLFANSPTPTATATRTSTAVPSVTATKTPFPDTQQLCGNREGNVTLGAYSSYSLECDLYVSGNLSITQPVTVMAMGDFGIYISGTMQTSGLLTTFTASDQYAGSWEGLTFTSPMAVYPHQPAGALCQEWYQLHRWAALHPGHYRHLFISTSVSAIKSVGRVEALA